MDYDALLGENRRLRACLDDLVRVMSFPAMWVGRDLPFIAESLLDAVQGLIDSEVTYLRLNNRSKGGADEWVRAPDALRRIVDELRQAKDPALEQSWQAVTAADRFHVAQFPVGLNGEQGALVVASRKKPFATEAQRLLLGVAVNLAGVALMSAQDAEERRFFLERRQQELQVRTQGALLQGIAESIAAPVVFLTPDGSIEVINDRLLGFFGKTRADMERWRTSDVIHPEDRQAAIDALRNAIATGRPYEVEARRRRSDGVYRWWRSNGYPMRDPDGKIARWCVLYTDIHDRKMAEEALRLRALDFQLVVDSIPVPVAVTTPSGEVEGVNQATMDYFGKTFEELKHWESSELVHPADIADTIAAQRRAHESASTYNVQSRHRRFDGTYRWFNVVGVPLRDREGNILRWLHLIIDIEDRKRAEEALAASERKLERIINTIPAMAWSANPDGTCDFFNRHHLDYVGRELGEMTGVGFVSTFHPDDVDRLMQAWQAMLDTGQGGEVEGRIRRRDGEYRWCLFRTNPLFDDNGVLIKWFGINIDIEDRKRAEEAVRTSERNLRGLTESIPQMIWRTSPDGLVDYGNSRFLEYTGYTAEEILGTGWIRILHPDDVDRTTRVWAHAVATGEPYHIEYRVRRAADDSYRWCLVTALPLRDEDGTIMKWHGCCIDVHDWKLAQDELRATQAELAHATRVTTMGQLTASIAHELNQPLAGIMTNAATGLRMLGGDPPNVLGATETVRRTMRDAQRASDVISRLRALFSRRPMTTEFVDISTATKEVVALSSHELQRKGISLRAELDPRLPYLIGDRVQLQQVILNLVLNGAEAMEGVKGRSAELVISTALETSGDIRVSVRDCGTGLNDDAIEKLFNPFFTTKSSGMGIGLSVSRTIVENHKGRLWAENNDGPGATFSFSVPSATSEPPV